MAKPGILVTGATGRTGSVVVTELLKAGYPVRALVHGVDERSARLAAQGAEVAVADLTDAERIADALRGMHRAYFCPPFDPYMVQGALARFLATPLTRGFDLDRYDRELRRPFPYRPQFAPESAIWRREHVVARAEHRPPVAPASYTLARR